MAKYLLFVFKDCVDPLWEKEFNDWQKNDRRDQTD
jgi:hypothetical protein